MLQMEADDVCSATTNTNNNIINHNQNTTTTTTTINNSINNINNDNNITNTTNNHHNKSVECQNFNVKSATTTTTTIVAINVQAEKKERLTSELCAPTLLHMTASAPSLQQHQPEEEIVAENINEKTLKELTTSTTCDTHVQRSLSNASVTPTKMVRKSIDSMASLRRRVSFPKYDNELVTGYLEPANPWQYCMYLHAYIINIK